MRYAGIDIGSERTWSRSWTRARCYVVPALGEDAAGYARLFERLGALRTCCRDGSDGPLLAESFVAC